MSNQPSGNLHDNHRARIRKRYMDKGLDAFAEHEVLELLLYYCYPRRDTNEIAHRMINAFGSLHGLFEADVNDIRERCGVSENVAVLVSLIPPLSNLYFRSRWSRDTALTDVDTAGRYAVALCAGRTVETFYVLCLDTQRRINHVSMVAEGTLDETAVYPREIVSEALTHQATAVILVHNHPGGSIRPSRRDLDVTKKIVEGLQFLKIEVLDHIVVAGEQYYSFAARGQFVAGY